MVRNLRTIVLRHSRIEWALSLALIACAEPAPVGLAPTVREAGAPVVVFDPEAKPLPEIPLPNDLATSLDPTEPYTGRRINIPIDAPTRAEREIRRKALENNGFGTYMPITVSFTRPLDIENLKKRHTRNVSFEDDAVFVIDVTPGSPTFGEAVPLDMGQGNFPLVLPQFDKYFQNDPRSESSNLLFETEDEDVNLNGQLDPGEDTDHDGVLDVPNVHPEGGDIVDDLLVFYEKETNTLILRPIVPLRQETTYAVVLTRRLTGVDGVPVASPFPYVNHAMQTEALAPLPGILEQNKWGIGLKDVAFAWTFTTQSVTRELEMLRDGLFGKGVFAWLAESFPPSDFVLRKVRAHHEPAYLLPIDDLLDMLEPVLMAVMNNEVAARALADDLKNLDYMVGGLFRTPFFLEDKDGIASPNYPADEDESFKIDTTTGSAVVGERWVPFMCAIPRKSDHCVNGKKPVCSFRRACNSGNCSLEKVCRCTPYPVIVYLHGYGGARYEALGFAGRHAALGFATCAIDAHGHGLDLSTTPITKGDGSKLPVGELLLPILEMLDLPGLMDVLSDHRARDLNNDGVLDPAADFWTYDVFHTRDTVRQSIIDNIQFLRLLRSFDGTTMSPFDTDGDGLPERAGDFDGDGHVDLGGPDVPYFAWGQSMGGILSPILATVEPSIEAVAPVAGAAGLFDVAMRSINPGVPEAVFLPLFGPLVIGERGADPGTVRVSFLIQDIKDNFPVQLKLPFLETKLFPGDRVVLRNLRNGEVDEALVGPEGDFRVAVPADALPASEKRFILGMGDELTAQPADVPDPLLLGDPLELEFYDGPTGMLTQRVRQFGMDVVFQGARYTAGSRLVAPVTGFGLKRGTPKLRRFIGIASMFIESGDPVGYVPHLLKDFLPMDPQEANDYVHPGAAVLIIPSAGDMMVPVNTEIAMARAAGVIDLLHPSDDYCVPDALCALDPNNPLCSFDEKCLTPNQVILATYTAEGISWLHRFDRPPWNDPRDVLFDIDDLDDGALPWRSCTMGETGEYCVDGPDAPDLRDAGMPPLRITTSDGSSGMRIFLGYISDRHGFDPPTPQWAFDMNTYFANLVGRFFLKVAQGKPSTPDDPWIIDDPCLEDSSCPEFQ